MVGLQQAALQQQQQAAAAKEEEPRSFLMKRGAPWWRRVKMARWMGGGSGWDDYPLVMTKITMENHHVFYGKIHYFYGHFQ